MINQNELRIGNWYLAFGVDYQQVEQITKGKVLIDFNPIPLTEDIILKCGFVDNQIELYEDLFLIVDEDDEYNVLLKTRDVPGTSYVLPFIYLGTSIKHLHQLQNLYFALTGEELICNLK